MEPWDRLASQPRIHLVAKPNARTRGIENPKPGLEKV